LTNERRGVGWVPLAKLALLETTGGGNFTVADASGTVHVMSDLELVNASDLDNNRVAVSAADPRFWPHGALAPEPLLLDRMSDVAALQGRMKQLLPSADRLLFSGMSKEPRVLPLALAKPSDFVPAGTSWHVVYSGSWMSPEISLADAKGNRVKLDAASWQGTQPSRP
jgi:hypothetical protein